MVQKYSEKEILSEERKTKMDAESLLRVAVGAHAYRRTIEQRAAVSVKAERQHGIRPEDTSSRHLWLINNDERTSTGPLVLGYPLLGPYSVTFGYTTVRCSPALAFSADCRKTIAAVQTEQKHILS